MFNLNKISGDEYISSRLNVPRFMVDYLMKMDEACAILSLNGKLLWFNDSLKALSDKVEVGKNIGTIFNQLDKNYFDTLILKNEDVFITSAERKYKVVAKIEVCGNSDSVAILRIIDVTELYDLKVENENARNVIGFIYIDNFDEVSESLEDSKASMLLAMVDRRLTRYISYNSGVIKKLEKDKYFFVTTKKDLDDIIEDKFSILEQTKEIIGGDNIPLTLSIGIGYGGMSLEANHEYARIAMDLALGRGGDQAVVKNSKDTNYFGGKSASLSKNDRVRSRVKSATFKEILATKDKVLIMGHRDGDFDSFGACIGVCVMAKNQGKDCYIVINSLTQGVKEMKDKLIETGAYDESMFVDGNTALSLCDNNTLLIIVDHNVASMSDEPRLHEKELNFVVFDHHRISQNSLTDATLSYIDPSASSTCELVAEIMMYFEDRLKFKQMEADAMLSGIIIDTMHFTYQTGNKTFDAAAYLKKRGADSDRIRKILRIDFELQKVKNAVIDETEYYKEGFAIATVPANDGVDITVLRAMVANDLINIKGIKASIVISMETGMYNISCRSIDEVNSQVLMELVGGGGHRNSAGAMISAESMDDAKNKVKEMIDKFVLLEGGEK